MKKRLLFSILAAAAVLSACGDASDSESAGKAEETTAVTTTATTAAETENETVTETAETTTAETTADDTETEAAETETETASDTEVPNQDPNAVPDDMSDEDKAVFEAWLAENDIKGHFEDKENALDKECYYIPNDLFIETESVVYPDINKSIMMLCPIDMAYEHLDSRVVDMMKGRGLLHTSFRDWTDIEKEYYQNMYNYVPPCLYVEWQEDWTDKYIDRYVFIPE